MNDTADSRRQFYKVAVNRAHLLLLASPPAPAAVWTDSAMKAWWEAEGFTDGKKARDAFMKLAGTKGLSVSFEKCWQERHPGVKAGRPPKIRIKSARPSQS